jgi:hypothetical protein
MRPTLRKYTPRSAEADNSRVKRKADYNCFSLLSAALWYLGVKDNW